MASGRPLQAGAGKQHGSKVDIGGRACPSTAGAGSPTHLEAGLTVGHVGVGPRHDGSPRPRRSAPTTVGTTGGAIPSDAHRRQSVADPEKLLDGATSRPYVLVAGRSGDRRTALRRSAPRSRRDGPGGYGPGRLPERGVAVRAGRRPRDSYWASENEEKLDLRRHPDSSARRARGPFGPTLAILTPSTPNSGNIGEGGSQGLPAGSGARRLYLRPREAECRTSRRTRS